MIFSNPITINTKKWQISSFQNQNNLAFHFYRICSTSLKLYLFLHLPTAAFCLLLVSLCKSYLLYRAFSMLLLIWFIRSLHYLPAAARIIFKTCERALHHILYTPWLRTTHLRSSSSEYMACASIWGLNICSLAASVSSLLYSFQCSSSDSM